MKFSSKIKLEITIIKQIMFLQVNNKSLCFITYKGQIVAYSTQLCVKVQMLIKK